MEYEGGEGGKGGGIGGRMKSRMGRIIKIFNEDKYDCDANIEKILLWREK